MPHFHLNQYSEGRAVLDEEGGDYASLEEAIGDAAEAAREIMAERLRRGDSARGSEFHIVQESGQLVAKVRFEDVMAGKPFPPAPAITPDLDD